MPPLEALCTPVRLRMDQWHEKRDEWQKAVSGALGPPMEDRFLELEVTKQIAFDCARPILGTTGGRRLRIIPHHSEEVKWLKNCLTLLRVVVGERYTRGRSKDSEAYHHPGPCGGCGMLACIQNRQTTNT